MSLWVHLLDMATRDCNLDLIEAFVAKMFEIFCHLELRQVYMDM
jgi:phosphoribosyl-AMP cyclohydrolase